MSFIMPSPRGLQSATGADGEILVAIDLGTTFSGVAWTHTARPGTHTVIDQWPDEHDSLDGITSAKVPTEICYDEDGIRWGFQIPASRSRYQCFKLDLEPSVARNTSHLAFTYRDPKALRTDRKVTAEKLNTDYLTCLRKHISRILQLSLCDNVLETTPLRFILTVPAIWSEAAQEKTRSCAERAGMGSDVKLVLEPEAAIVHAVDQELSKLDVGDIVVVCDAGGGTVDLTSYIMEQVNPTYEISEAAPGAGHACGSNFLNRIFRKRLEESFSSLPGWADDTLESALESFERVVKRKFNGSDDPRVIQVPGVLDAKDAGIVRGRLLMPGGQIRTDFEPIISTITSLVQMQIDISKRKGHVKIVYLVGGFGENAWLRQSLKRVVPEGTQVTSPTDAWTAVLRGALIVGLAEASSLSTKVRIVSRAARKAYGCRISTRFRAGVHQHSRKYFDSFEGHYRIYVMDWFVKKGYHLKENEHSSVDYVQEKLVTDGRFDEMEVTLYSFESNMSRPDKDHALPLYQENGAKQLVKLTADLSSIPTSMLPIKKGADRKKYYRISFQIRVNFKPAHMTYSLWYKNTCYGTVDAEYL